MIDVMERLEQLERQVRRQRLMLIAGGIAGGAALLTGFAAGPADLIETKAIRIVDAAGTPRILIGAPAPSDGRVRKDGQTASVVVLGPDGQDRVVLGEAPNPRLDGKSYPRVAASYGLVISDKNGSERGAVNYLDNGRGVIALDRPGGDAVSMIVNEQSGFAGFTVNYANPLGNMRKAGGSAPRATRPGCRCRIARRASARACRAWGPWHRRWSAALPEHRQHLDRIAAPTPRQLVRDARLGAAEPPARYARGRSRRAAWAARRDDRRGQDVGRVPADPGRADRIPDRGLAHPLRLAAQGAGGRRAAQSADPGRGDGPRHPHRDAHRRHLERPQGAPARPPAANPADHARIAQPAPVLSRQFPDVRGAEDDRGRRSARLRDGQARRPALVVHGAAAAARAGAAAAWRCRRRSPMPTAIAPGSRPMAISTK